MSKPAFRRFTEDPNAPHRMGRHQVHDWLLPRNTARVDHTEPIVSVDHMEYQDVFDQGDVGSCTMNAAYGVMVSGPFGKPGQNVTQNVIQDGYRMETRLDDSQIPGHWEPDDTGSTGPWSMVVLQQLGLITTWQHTLDLSTALRMLNHAPISFGGPWFNSFFKPGLDDVLVLDESEGLGGGHQFAITANDAERRRAKIRQSWGRGYGDRGHAWITWTTLDDLLAGGGDVVQPIL